MFKLIPFSGYKTMKLIFLVFTLMVTTILAENDTRYSCPEVHVDFDGNNLWSIGDVKTWQECGEHHPIII